MALDPRTRENIQKLNARDAIPMHLNHSRVPLQGGQANLLIGLGGTGIDALLEAKGLISMTCCKDGDMKNNPERIAYLAFDTDKKARDKTSSDRTGKVKLSDSELKVLYASTNITAFLDPNMRNLVPDYISSWLDPDITFNGDGNGAGGIRQAGRLLMFDNYTDIVGKIQNAITNLMTCAGENGGLTQVNVFIMAGIGGGTGSGTVYDMAYVVQKVVKSLIGGQIRATYYGYLFLPDVNLANPELDDGSRIRVPVNGYAALQELDYLMSLNKNGDRFIQKYHHAANCTVDFDEPPFTYAHLIGAYDQNGNLVPNAYGRCTGAVAQNILALVCSETSVAGQDAFSMTSFYDNIAASMLVYDTKYPEREHRYLALGSSSYDLPVDKIMLYVTSLLFEKMDALFENEPKREEINAEFAKLGLTPDKLLERLVPREPAIPKTDWQTIDWEEVFGKRPIYQNLNGMANRFVQDIDRDAPNIVAQFLAAFEPAFRDNMSANFLDQRRGPVWVNKAIVLDEAQKNGRKGFIALLHELSNWASSKDSSLQQEITSKNAELTALYNKVKEYGVLTGKGTKQQGVQEYLRKLNELTALMAKRVCMKYIQTIAAQVAPVVRERNNEWFAVVVSILQELKGLTEKNTEILLDTKLQNTPTGQHFTWQPITVPAISQSIRDAFDKNDRANNLVGKFVEALLRQADEWAGTEAVRDVAGFVQKYLDENVNDIATETLQTYVKVLLSGDKPLADSVKEDLAPKLELESAPLLWKNNSIGTDTEQFYFSVPNDCTEIVQGAMIYQGNKANGAVQLQRSKLNTRIFMQSILPSVSLAAYWPAAEYEAMYRNTKLTGKHLYHKWDLEQLPSLIPFRSRSKNVNACPDGVRSLEDGHRALYQESLRFHVIREYQNAPGKWRAELYLTQPQDLEAIAAKENYCDGAGRPVAEKLEKILARLRGWLDEGLPVDTENVFAVQKIFETTNTDFIQKFHELSQECFIAQYHHTELALEECKKYRALEAKVQEMQTVLDQLNEGRAAMMLLTQGLLTRIISFEVDKETSTRYYVWHDNANDFNLTDVSRLLGVREYMAAQALREMRDAGGLKEERFNKLKKLIETAYRKATVLSSKEERSAMIGLIDKLLAGVESRKDVIANDIADGIAMESETPEALSFYEKMFGYLQQQKRELMNAPELDDGEDVLF